MRKKILGGVAVAAVALALAFNLSVKQNTNQLSLLALANVEALADGENGNGQGCTQKSSKNTYSGKCSASDRNSNFNYTEYYYGCSAGGSSSTCLSGSYTTGYDCNTDHHGSISDLTTKNCK